LGDGHICVESVCKIRNRSVAYSLSSDGHRLWKQHFEKNAFKVLRTFIRVWDENFSFFFCYLHRVVDSRPVFKCSRRNAQRNFGGKTRYGDGRALPEGRIPAAYTCESVRVSETETSKNHISVNSSPNDLKF